MELRISTRGIFRVVKWVAIIALIVFSVMAGINARDEAPNSGIASFVSDPRPPVPDAENAFFTLLAFDAPMEMDAHAEGMTWASRREAAIKEDPYTNELPIAKFQMDPQYSSNLMQGFEMDNMVCGVGTDCTKGLTSDDFVLLSYVHKYSAALARYESLYAFPHYRVAQTPVMTLQSTQNLMKGFGTSRMHQLELGKAILALHKKDVDEALGILARDAKFWRMVLAETSDKDTKWDAVDMITEDLNLLGDIMPRGPFDKNGQDAIVSMLQPLSAEELDLRPAIRRDFMTHRNLAEGIAHGQKWHKVRNFYIWYMLKFTTIPQNGSWVVTVDDAYYKLFYQPNATVNRAYLHAAGALAVTSVSAREYAMRVHGAGCLVLPLAFSKNPCESKLFGEDDERPWGGLYNRPARYLNTVDRFSYVSRARTLFNLQGYIRLLTLQFKVRQEKIAEQDLGGFLGHAAADLSDPYTGKPMRYDPENHKLYFLGMSRTLMQDMRMAVSL